MIKVKAKRILSILVILLAVVFAFQAETEAAPEEGALNKASMQIPAAKLGKIRYSNMVDKTRIVCELSAEADYIVTVQESPPRLIIELENSEIAGVPPIMPITDTLATQVMIVPGQGQRVKIVIDLAYESQHNVFRLSSPSRLVIDLLKSYEQKTERMLDRGLRYISSRKNTKAGSLAVHILDFDLLNSSLKLDHILAKDEIMGLETVTSMATRTNAVAAINGTYFAKNGELLGLVVHNDQILQSPVPKRTAFALKNSGEIMIDQVYYSGKVEGPDGISCDIKAINRWRGPDEVVVYTSAFGKTTQTNQYGKEYTVIGGKVTQIGYGNAVIPVNGFVISSHGDKMNLLTPVKVGDQLTIRDQLDPWWTDVRLAIGAGPQLVKDGNIFLTTKSEGFGGDVGGGRAPRTALGVTPNQHLLLVIVDGRQPGYSDGMTLIELAKLMHDLGAKDAMNLDGGGSAELVIGGQVVNRPSDGKERPIGDALVLVPVQQETEIVTITPVMSVNH
jgi:exopolysaccharide biosynthesis protein